MAIRVVDFNLLPARTRERFVAITKGRGGPAPIFARRSATGAIVG